MLSLLGLAALVSTVSTAPLRIRSQFAVKESHPVPRQWTRISAAHPDHVINLQIGLKQSQFDELERHLYEVSTPSHSRYGQHLTEDEVNDLVKPTDDTLTLVHEWLEDNGIAKADLEYSPAKDWLKILLPISEIERLLDTKYSVFAHEEGDFLVRTPEWSLPLHLHEHIEVIQPTNSFFRPRQQATNVKTVDDIFDIHAHPAPPVYTPPAVPSIAAVCNTSAVTPLCLRTLYGTIDYIPEVPGKNKVGLNDFLDESNNRSDTSLFLKAYRPEAAAAAYEFQVKIIANGNDEQTQENSTELENGKDLEGNLDVETIIGIDWPTPLIAYSTGGSPPFNPDLSTPSNTNEPYLTWLNYVLAQKDIPQVISTSYADDEQTIPYSYAKSVCNGFAQLGARGISLFFGSGDSGVGKNGTCFTNDGKNTSTFLPMFPTTCPFVTAVGGTKNIPEVVAYNPRNAYSSGGGFSRYFPQPRYQADVVDDYVDSLDGEFDGLYNPKGRAYPDIAAQGYHYITIWNGTIHILDGTSAATPTAAAIFALVNDALIAKGRPPMGFLNPWLYEKGIEAFTDVINGSAIGCGGAGFPAVEGWDAVTGFGTPYFPKILDLVGCGNDSEE